MSSRVAGSTDRVHRGGAVGENVGPFAVRAGARVGLTFAAPFDAASSVVTVDGDGDGSVDRRVGFVAVTGIGDRDMDAPVTTASMNRYFDDTSWRADIVLTATDDGGSGVLRIEYALDTTATAAVYEGPFTVPAHGELYARSIDNACNVEAPHLAVVLDDAPSRPDLVQEYLVPHFNRTGLLEFIGDVDVWGGAHRITKDAQARPDRAPARRRPHPARCRQSADRLEQPAGQEV